MLTPADHEDFVRNGFLLKPGLLSKEDCKLCMDVAWPILNGWGITEDPTTWQETYRRRGVVKLRDDVDGNETLDRIIGGHEAVSNVISELIGSNARNLGVRGVYPTFPIPKRISRPYEAHIENHPVQIFVMYYLDDVDEQGAGLYVWPGSHVDVYNSMQRKFDYIPKDSFIPVFEKHNVLKPFEWTGKAGDVMFAHHRIMHSGSNNFNNSIRFAILHDFLNPEYERVRLEPSAEDEMWDYWAPEVKAAAQRLGNDAGPSIPRRRSIVRETLIRGQQFLRQMKGAPRHDYIKLKHKS